MKIKLQTSKTIDQNGFGVVVIPTIYLGWENYGYQKVVQIYTHFLVWTLLLEFHSRKAL